MVLGTFTRLFRQVMKCCNFFFEAYNSVIFEFASTKLGMHNVLDIHLL